MKSLKDIKHLVKNTKIKPTSKMRSKVLDEALELQRNQNLQSIFDKNAWRIIMNSRITKFAVAAVIIVAALVGINQFGGSIDGSSVAFAKVVDSIRYCSYSFDLIVEPGGQSSKKEFESISAKGAVYQSRKLCLDWIESDTEVSVVVDYDANQILQILHKSKLGRIQPYTAKINGDLSFIFNKPVEELWRLEDGSEEFIGEKELYSHIVIGFKVIQNGFEIIVWADSDSGHPMYVEAVSMATNDSSLTSKWVMDNFDFESEPEEELFGLDGPAEYTIVNELGKVIRKAAIVEEYESTYQGDSHTESISGLLIKPLEGIGVVKFGMTCEKIIEILGKPDQIIGKHCLDYSSTVGLSLLVHSERGLLAMDCWSQNEKSNEGHLCGTDFTGKTSAGVGINSTRNEIIRQYGNDFEESLSKDHTFELYYPSLNTIFHLRNDKVVHISLNIPR